MKTLKGRLVSLLIGTALLPGAAVAALVFDNGQPILNGNDLTVAIQAEDFTLSAGATIGAVRFWDMELSSGFAGSVTWWIYSDTMGAPGTVLFTGTAGAVTHAATGRTVNYGSLFTEYQNEFAIDPVTLGPGTYWLGLHNGPLTTVHNLLYWEMSAWSGNGMEQPVNYPYQEWRANGSEHAFQLEAAVVPEPSALLAGMLLLVPFALQGLRYMRNRTA